MFLPVTQALIEEAQIAPGYSVLDVATGPGEPALSIIDIVGATGEVVGIDPAPGMIEAAKRAALSNRFGKTHFEVASADHLPFSTDRFDAVVSRFGVMFFPSPLDGVREMLRVLKPNRKIAFAVWGSPEANGFFYVFNNIMNRHVPPEPEPPGSPDAFYFAARGKLLDILNQAGAVQTTERLLQFKIEVPLSADDTWALRFEMSEKFRKRITSVPQEQADAIRREGIEDLRSYSTGRGIAFPAEVLIVSATKP
jgi:SAM-dependent methyltransferase